MNRVDKIGKVIEIASRVPLQGRSVWEVVTTGIMVSEVYEALIAAGAPEDKPKAAPEAIPVSGLLASQGRHRLHQAETGSP